jgi:hypothetical protein
LTTKRWLINLSIIAIAVSIIDSCQKPTEIDTDNQQIIQTLKFITDSTQLIAMDTVGNLLIDTLHVAHSKEIPLSFAVVKCSTEDYSATYYNAPDGMTIKDSIVSWTPSYLQGEKYRIWIRVKDTLNNCDTLEWPLQILYFKKYPIGSWEPWGTIPGRYCHTAVVFNNKFWMIAGVDNLSDVWNSTDGKNWTCATSNAAFGPRHYHASVVFQNKIWVIAGSPGKSDVWYSGDGINWTIAVQNAPFGVRSAHKCIVFKDGIYLVGGVNDKAIYDPDVKFYNDVWFSSDGISWEQKTSSAQFHGRAYHALTVFKDRLWVIGGFDGVKDYNDCWSSTDGVNWDKMSDSAEFTPRRFHSVLSFENGLWLFSGFSLANHETSSIWHSSDGVKWRRINGATFLSEPVAYSSASLVNNDTMWIFGGYSDPNVTYFSLGFK